MVDQQGLEKKFRPGVLVHLSPGAVTEEIFGPLEGWILEVGNNRLLLNPLNGYWLYEDPIHANSWEITGFQAGEVLFYLEGEELAVRLNPDPPAWEDDGRFDLAEQFYRRLSERLSAEAIDQVLYEREIEKLRFQDKMGAWWQIRSNDGSWLTWDGISWVKATPDREVPKNAAGEDRRRFLELKEKFFALWREKEEGKLTTDKYTGALHNLKTEDSSGAWWQLTENGSWLKWDGANWTEAEPDI